MNEWVYPAINNGVYRCGFATSQAAYDTGARRGRGGRVRGGEEGAGNPCPCLPAASCASLTNHSQPIAPSLPPSPILPPPTPAPAAFDELFAALDRCEEILGRQRFIAGPVLTEADIR